MASSAVTKTPTRKKPAPLAYFLGFIFVLFIGILVFAYVVTKRTNPVLLDEHGKPVNSSSDQGHGSR